MQDVPAPKALPRFIDESSRWFGNRTKTALAVASFICIAIVWFLGYLTNVPQDRGFNASLLAQSSPILALFVTALSLLICTLLMNALQSGTDIEDPLFPAAISLLALSCRGGTMTSLLQLSSLNVFWLLIVELVLLYAMIAGVAWVLTILRRRRSTTASMQDPSDWSERFLCTFAATLIMGICMYLLAQTDDKKQVLAAVGISAFTAAAAAYTIFDVHVVLCYVAAPLIVGVFGYLLGIIVPGAWQTGRIGQPLAFPLPLDYASVGFAGALLGYWSAQKWKAEGHA